MAISLEIALSIVQEILGQSKLTEVQEAIFRGVWAKRSYQEIINQAAQNGFYYSLGHLKNTASELWQSLSDALGERVTKNNLPTLLEHYQQQHQTSKLDRQDWGEAVLPAQFYGRTRELTTLKSWITKDQCRVVALLGMGGMGKTSLAIKLAQEIRETTQYERIFWRSLLNAPAIDCILQALIQFLADQQEVEIATTVEGKITQALAYLRQTRCLVVLDNIESILQDSSSAGAYRPGYEAYGLLMQRFAEVEHSSCLLLTSREKPREVAWAEGPNLLVRSFLLKGLTFSAGQTIFQHKGCFGLDDRAMQNLFNHYAGNPLALNMVASGVQELFDGDLKELLPYMQQGWLRFDDINDVLNRQFDRLSSAEQEVMYWLAINREPVSHLELMEDIVSVTVKQQLLEALKSLARRCLIERNEKCWSLQPVVMEYVTNRLIQQVCREVVQQDYTLLNSHALLKAQGKDYIRQAQSSLILQPLLNCLLTSLGGKKNVEYSLKNILEELRIQAPLRPGYAGGNILNLLRELGADFSYLDCSYLAVWQAYLADANLQQVNFSHAHFSKTIFTETLSLPQANVFSPDGKLIATAGGDGEIRIWRLTDRTQLLTCRDAGCWIWSVAFSPDGCTLASGGSDHTVKLWDVQTGECLKVLRGHTGWVWSVAFNSDAKTLASGSSDGTIRLWNTQSWECEKTLWGHSGGVWSAKFSPDGRQLVSGSEDRTVRIWNAQTGQEVEVLKGHQDVVYSVNISADGKMAVSASQDSTVRIWDLSTKQQITNLIGHRHAIQAAFSPDSKIVVSSSFDNTIKLWNIANGHCLRTLRGHAARITSISFCTDGSHIASSSDDQTMRIWNAKTGEILKIFQGYSAGKLSVTFSPDGEYLASGSEDKIISLWHLKGERQPINFLEHKSWVLAVALSPDGCFLASGSDDKTVKLWDIHSRKCLRTIAHNCLVLSIAFSPDGQTIASTTSENLVRLWETKTGRLLRTLEGQSSRIWSVTFSPDGRFVAAGEQDKVIQLWKADTGECVATLQGHQSIVFSVAFSPDGQTLASASDDRTVRLWNILTGECIQVFQGHTNLVLAVAFSPDGKILASSGQDRTIKLWDIQTGKCLHTFEGHEEAIKSIAFSPKAPILASASRDETVRLWDLKSYQCIEVLKGDRPYEKMNLSATTGLTKAQIDTLKLLGAVEQQSNPG